MEANKEIFGTAIFTYTRQNAIEDGVLWEASSKDQDEAVQSVCTQHFPGVSVATTMPVFETMRKAVENPRHSNDYAGILHDMLWMARMHSWRGDRKLFKVIIVGAGRVRNYIFKMERHADEEGRPCITIMLPEED